MSTDILILTVALVAIFGLIAYIYVIKSSRGDNSTDALATQELSKRIDILGQSVTTNLNTVTDRVLTQHDRVTLQVNSRMKESSELMQMQQKSVGERLVNAGRVIKEVTASISRLEESNKKVHDIAKDLTSLQDILKMPKLRGGLGELFLGELLSQIFTRDQYQLQYRFKSGEIVDAVVKLHDDQLVCVDAKFPLENFKKMIEEKDEKEAERLRKAFVVDVKKHIDDIARKYILPDEGTLGFALMYVPAENVYYETIIKDAADVSISQYGLSKNVIPVSPNSFNVYLHTILIGMRGMQIEKSAREIFNNLSRLRTEFGKFGEDFELVGTHLGRAQSSYEKSEKRLDKLSDKLGSISLADSRDHQALESGDALDVSKDTGVITETSPLLQE